jgi:hypothetical protein
VESIAFWVPEIEDQISFRIRFDPAIDLDAKRFQARLLRTDVVYHEPEMMYPRPRQVAALMWFRLGVLDHLDHFTFSSPQARFPSTARVWNDRVDRQADGISIESQHFVEIEDRDADVDDSFDHVRSVGAETISV